MKKIVTLIMISGLAIMNGAAFADQTRESKESVEKIYNYGSSESSYTTPESKNYDKHKMVKANLNGAISVENQPVT